MPTSRFTDVTEEQFAILIFQCLVSIFDNGSLCSVKAKVIRDLFYLESPKTEIRIWLPHGPTLSEFLSHFEQEFDNVYFYFDGSPRSLF